MNKTLALLIVVSAGYAASAQSIPINNASFENPAVVEYSSGGIPDWTLSGSTDVGVLNPTLFPFTGMTAPDGVQVGYINGWGIQTSLSQTLGATLQADTFYNLSIEVGGRTDGFNPGTDYSVSLYAGGNLLTSVNPVTPPTGSWTTLDATYSSGAVVTPDQDLEIVISTDATQLDFDNVKLSVPDAGSVSWLAGLALMGFARFVRVRR